MRRCKLASFAKRREALFEELRQEGATSLPEGVLRKKVPVIIPASSRLGR